MSEICYIQQESIAAGWWCEAGSEERWEQISCHGDICPKPCQQHYSVPRVELQQPVSGLVQNSYSFCTARKRCQERCYLPTACSSFLGYFNLPIYGTEWVILTWERRCANCSSLAFRETYIWHLSPVAKEETQRELSEPKWDKLRPVYFPLSVCGLFYARVKTKDSVSTLLTTN